MEYTWPTALHNYSASFETKYCPIALWENPKACHFHDFGSSGRVHDSQNQYDLSSETPEYFSNEKHEMVIFQNPEWGINIYQKR